MNGEHRQTDKVGNGGGSSIVDIGRHTLSSTIAVIGTGNFGIALTKELAVSGLSVCIGSRNPTQQQGLPKKCLNPQGI